VGWGIDQSINLNFLSGLLNSQNHALLGPVRVQTDVLSLLRKVVRVFADVSRAGRLSQISGPTTLSARRPAVTDSRTNGTSGRFELAEQSTGRPGIG